MGKKKSINLKNYKRKRQMNIGIFLFAIVFIYLAAALVMSAADKKIGVYEVRGGSILQDNSYTGLAIRKENVIYAEASGYINYFQTEYSKMKAGMNVAAVTDSKLPDENAAGKGRSISAEEQEELTVYIQNFNENFSRQRFSSVYTLKDEVSNFLMESSNSTQNSHIDKLLNSNDINASIFTAPFDGIVLHYIDGYEDITEKSYGAPDFDRNNYESTVRKDNDYVKTGEPVYKLVTDEKWYIIIQLGKETADKLRETTIVKTRLDKDSETMWAKFSISEKDGELYGTLEYNDSMIRYAGERFINVELILKDESGLKIPKSAVTEQQFYTVPEEYITSGGNTLGPCVIMRNEEGGGVCAPVKIYKISKEGIVYIGMEGIPQKSVLIKPNSSDTYTISEKKPLKGVFNVNKGYAIFRQVDILCESDDYYIVKSGDMYGLHHYDHIVQDADTVSENEVVFQ